MQIEGNSFVKMKEEIVGRASNEEENDAASPEVVMTLRGSRDRKESNRE